MKTSLYLFLAILLIFPGCNSKNKEAIRQEEKVYQIHQTIIDNEARLQQQIAEVMEIQMDENNSMYMDTSNQQLQREIDSMYLVYEELKTQVAASEKSIRQNNKLKAYPLLLNASADFIDSYGKIVNQEYSVLLQLISLKDTAYTNEKHQAYLSTIRQLNNNLDNTVKQFNKSLDNFEEKHFD
ncbi:MAG: hypothetical protein R6T91_07095 [Bacteroidales bacterium]